MKTSFCQLARIFKLAGILVAVVILHLSYSRIFKIEPSFLIENKQVNSLFPWGKFTKNDLQHGLSDKSGTLPFVSGVNFLLYSDFIFDDKVRTVESSLSRIKQSDIVFVKTDLIADFFLRIFPRIKVGIILVTQNSDYSADYFPQIEDKRLIVWFGQNPSFVHRKLIPAPIGLENPHHGPSKLEFVRKIDEESLIPWEDRKYLLYVSFNPSTNPAARERLLSFFKNFEGVLIANKRVSFQEFMQNTGNSKFMLCPRGNGLDTHRFYETILMGAIPVVENSTLWPIYRQSTTLVLPDLERLTLEMLKSPQSFISDMSFSRRVVLWSTWAKLIDSYKRD